MPNDATSKFFRNWRNADRFKPNITPPRQKFAGFVEFVFNPSVITGFGNQGSALGDSSAFRTQISSLVQTAKIPEIQFNTTTKKQYNYRRLIQTGVDYGPCNISVIDTVNNEWLAIFMKYFAYYYNEPRNRTNEPQNGDRDQNPQHWPSNRDVTTSPGTFQSTSFASNNAGLDAVKDAHLFDYIKIIQYAGGKGVEYILFRPQFVSFDAGELDYTSSDFRTFDMSFEIEHMTVNTAFNFTLNDTDLARFDNSAQGTSMVVSGTEETKNGPSYKEQINEFLGTRDKPRTRTGQ